MSNATSSKSDSNAQRPLTPAHEDYLKTIYILSNRGEKVTNSALASQLDVAPASATNMIKKLANLRLVEYSPYQSIQLTESGEKIALEVLRHHRLIELYLHEVLNIPLEQVHDEAEKLEHVLSESVEKAMADALGNPTIDPHGDPIPTMDGHVAVVEGFPLPEADVGQSYRLVRVLIQDQERLGYLGKLGLHPNAELRLLERAPFNGPLLIDVNGEHSALAHDLAQMLIVTEKGSHRDEPHINVG